MFSVCILFLLLHNMMNSYDPDVLHSLTEIISQILISCQSTTCNVLLRCNTSSSIILKQKYYLRWSKNRKMQFSCGEIYGRLLFLLISCLQECVRWSLIISHISTLWQSTQWNVLVGYNTPSSIILKQKYNLKLSKNRKLQFLCGEIYGWLSFLCKNVREDDLNYLNHMAINPVEGFGRLQYTLIHYFKAEI